MKTVMRAVGDSDRSEIVVRVNFHAGLAYLHPIFQSALNLVLINQLPDDILCYIFALDCREKTDTVHLPFNWSNIPPQVTISHVCSLWREVILNMPFLWNDFKVFMDNAKDGDMLMNIVHDWLFRAKSLPCSLTLDFKVNDSIPSALKQEHWYSSIVKHLISQFRFQKLKMPWSSTHWTQFLQLPVEKLGCIEDLHICCINPPSISNFDVLPSKDGFKKLTKLTSLQLDQSRHKSFGQIVYSEDPVFAHVPWHQLRHIHLTIPTPLLLCFTILQHSSMVLETCVFAVLDSYDTWAEIQSLNAEPLHCPQLKMLKLEARCHPDQSYFSGLLILDLLLSRIRMPNLKVLVVGRYRDWTSRSTISSSTLDVMRDVSNMQLEEFVFYHPGCVMDVGHLLTTFPSLKRVEVMGRTRFYNDTIHQLGSGLIGPYLEELIILRHGINSLEKLLQMMKARSSIRKFIDHDEWRVANEPASFRYVKFYLSGLIELESEYKEKIEEINRYYGVQLVVEPFDLRKAIGLPRWP